MITTKNEITFVDINPTLSLCVHGVQDSGFVVEPIPSGLVSDSHAARRVALSYADLRASARTKSADNANCTLFVAGTFRQSDTLLSLVDSQRFKSSRIRAPSLIFCSVPKCATCALNYLHLLLH